MEKNALLNFFQIGVGFVLIMLLSPILVIECILHFNEIPFELPETWRWLGLLMLGFGCILYILYIVVGL